MKSIILGIVSVLCLLFITHHISGQKVLQLEKRNSPKTIKYHEGDILTFKTHDYSQWQHLEIFKIYVDQDSIVTDSGFIYIGDISHVLPIPVMNASATMTSIFGTFGITVLAYTLIDPLMGKPYNWLAFYAGITSLGIAGVSHFLLPVLLKKKIGKKYQIRLLDLTFYTD